MANIVMRCDGRLKSARHTPSSDKRMANPVLTIISKLARKLAMAVLIAALTLLAYSLWLFVRESAGYEVHLSQRARLMENQRADVSREWTAANTKTETAIAALAAQQQRAVQIEKVIKGLTDLAPGVLDRVIGDREQQAVNETRLAHANQLKTETQTKIVDLQREVVEGEQKRTELKARLTVIEAEQAALQHEKNAIGHYVRIAWAEGYWVVYAAFFVYLFGGLVVGMFLYYGWAPVVAKGRTLQLRKGSVPRLSVSESVLTAEHFLWPGERLWVRKEFLQTADPALTRRSRLLPDWRRPLSWWLCGTRRLVELRNERSDGERQVVFAGMKNPFAELAVVAVPEGGSVVIRAGYVKGMIVDISRKPVITRHWRWTSWQSWVSGQFGYWEFCGRCRLIVSCVTSLQGRTLESPDEANPQSCRTVLANVAGFSPQLALKPVRTEGFWRYCRRQTPLFDLSLSGSGVFLTHELEGRGCDGLKARLLKRFGL
jgi:hypothetical protein